MAMIRSARPWVLVLVILALVAGSARPASAETVTRDQVTAALTQLDDLAQQMLASSGVPALSIAVVYKDEVVYLEGFGVRSATDPRPVDADTVFQLASLSKPLASTVVSAIVSDGAATWDDPLVRHDPGFALSDPWVTSQVTLRDMFAHRSGLPGGAGNDLEEIGYDRDAILRRLRHIEPASSFRSTYAYSNFGLTVGGVAAAKAAGMSWEEAAAEKLYRPLGMAATSSRSADYRAAPNRALIHVREGDAWVPRFERDADPQSPAGGVSSTARDLAQWLRLQLGEGTIDGRQIIKPEVLAQTHRPLIIRGTDRATGRTGFYGLGWDVDYDAQGRIYVNHAGAFAVGAQTVARLLPAENLGIVVLGNAFPTGLPEAVAYAFFDLVLQGQVTRDWLAFLNDYFYGLQDGFARIGAPYAAPPAQPSPALPPRAYTGAYANDYLGTVEVVEQDGGLVMLMGPGRRPYPLRHFDRDVFTQVAYPEPPAARSGVTFSIGPDGAAHAVVLEGFDDAGQGTLTRVAPGR